jgi:hypothetical protein
MVLERSEGPEKKGHQEKIPIRHVMMIHNMISPPRMQKDGEKGMEKWRWRPTRGPPLCYHLGPIGIVAVECTDSYQSVFWSG